MHAVLPILTFLPIFLGFLVTSSVGKMDGSVLETVKQRLCLANGVLAGVLELLDAASPDARVSPASVKLLLVTAAEEVAEASRELGGGGPGRPTGH